MYLSDQHDDPGEKVVELQHLAEEEQEVGEPHGGAEVVEDVAEAVGQPLPQGDVVLHLGGGFGRGRAALLFFFFLHSVRRRRRRRRGVLRI